MPSVSMSTERQAALLELARRTTPGGVHSNIRMSEQPQPLFFASARGARILDVDGNELIDYVMGQGPMLLGHSPRSVLDRVAAQLDRGVIFAGQHELEIEVGSRLLEAIPGAGKLRFGTTGTEAIMAAIRIARAATGRDRVIKFRGHYHGWSDSLLFNVTRDSAWDRDAASFAPMAESDGLADVTPPIILDWNDPEQIETVLRRQGDRVAAIIMEPVMANVYVVPPRAGYLEEVRRLCDSHGVLLIFDEVITGFRLARGGAQELFGVHADLAVYGKALASGFPVACVVARDELMASVGTGAVLLAGTFNSNPVGLAAANAVLDELTPDLYAGLRSVGADLLDGTRRIAAEIGSGLLVQGYPQLFGIAATAARAVDSFADTMSFDRPALAALLTRLTAHGVRASGRGTFFLSTAHDEEDGRTTLAAFAGALDGWVH